MSGPEVEEAERLLAASRSLPPADAGAGRCARNSANDASFRVTLGIRWLTLIAGVVWLFALGWLLHRPGEEQHRGHPQHD